MTSGLATVAAIGLALGLRLEVRPWLAPSGTMNSRPPLLGTVPEWESGRGPHDANWLVRLAGRDVRLLRGVTGRSTTAAAGEAMVAERTLRRWEADGRPPRLLHAAQMALASGGRLVWLPVSHGWWSRPALSPRRPQRGRRGPCLSASRSEHWASPRDVVDAAAAVLGPWALDVAAGPATAVCERWLGPLHPEWLRRDALSEAFEHWAELDPLPGPVWMNPPYGPGVSAWMSRAYQTARAGRTVVGLLPARTDTRAWHDWVAGGKARVIHIRGRLRFWLPDRLATTTAPFPSALVVWHPSGPDAVSTELARAILSRAPRRPPGAPTTAGRQYRADDA